MKIHEYQGKEILARFGIPVPRGYAAFSVREASEAAQKLGGSVWVVKAQIHAGGRGKGGGVKVAKTLDDVAKDAGQILGMQLKTHQTGPEGQKVRRLLVEEGADIKKEYYLAVLTDRASQKVALMGSSEGGMDIEAVAHDTPEKIVKIFVDPSLGMADADATTLADGMGIPKEAQPQAIDIFHKLYTCYMENRRVPRRDQPPDPRRREERRPADHQGARRQVQLRLERHLPASRDRRLPRPRRGRPGRDRGQQVRPRLHPARRQHRLFGERRRPGDGDDGHHQALRRRAGQLSRRRRRRHRREGDRRPSRSCSATPR